MTKERNWIPAFAGMTNKKKYWMPVYTGMTNKRNWIPAFAGMTIGTGMTNKRNWIPAFAGMTIGTGMTIGARMTILAIPFYNISISIDILISINFISFICCKIYFINIFLFQVYILKISNVF